MIKIIKKLIPSTDFDAFIVSLAVCLIVCYSYLLVVSPITGLSRNFGACHDGYIQLARNIVAGNGYVFEKDGLPVVHRPPLYPLFLVPAACFPEKLQQYVIIIPQSILVGLIGMMIFKIARRLYSRSVGILAFLLFLINPWLYLNAKNPTTAILQALLYLVITYFTALELFNKSTLKPMKMGLIIGVAGAGLALTHAAMLPAVILLLGILFAIAMIKNKNRIFTPVIAGLVMICLIAPWTYRNWAVVHRLIPVSGGGGLAYFNGNVLWVGIDPEPQKLGESYIDASLRVLGIDGTEQTRTHWSGFKDITLEDYANRKMIEHMISHPALLMKKVILNAAEYYLPAFTNQFHAIKSVSKSVMAEQWCLSIFHLFLWIMAAIGIFCCPRKGLFLLTGIIVYSIWYFPFATIIGHSLYTFGTIPFLCIISAVGIQSVLNRNCSSIKDYLS
ncbi:MAG: glycosyltransferase family 39 protein [Victivallales bacterium]